MTRSRRLALVLPSLGLMTALAAAPAVPTDRLVLRAQSSSTAPPAAGQGKSRTAAKGIGFPAIDSLPLIADLAALAADSMDGRRLGTAGNIRARAYILRQFLAANLSPFAQRFTFAFTAARARNEGWQLALQRWPAAAFVQFVDGDCEVREDWIATAHAHLLVEDEHGGFRLPQAGLQRWKGRCCRDGTGHDEGE